MGSKLQIELEELINKHCLENESNTPDFILANYLMACLRALDAAINVREVWHQDSEISLKMEGTKNG